MARQSKPSMPKEFTMEWYKELGWTVNPFEQSIPRPIEQFMSNGDIEKQRLNYFVIEQFPFGVVRGGNGSGKTMLLSWLVSELSKFKHCAAVTFVNAKEVSDKDFLLLAINAVMSFADKAYVTSFYRSKLHHAVQFVKTKLGRGGIDTSFFRKVGEHELPPMQDIIIFFQEKLGKKRLYVVLDDGENLSVQVRDFLAQLISHQVPVSIILAGSNDVLEKSGLTILNLEDKLGITIPILSYSAVRDMVHRRIEFAGGSDIEPFHDVELAELWDASKKNPKSFMKSIYESAVKAALKTLKEHPKPIEDLPENVTKEQILSEGNSVEDGIALSENDVFTPPKVVSDAIKSDLQEEVVLNESVQDKRKYQIKVKDHEQETIEIPDGGGTQVTIKRTENGKNVKYTASKNKNVVKKKEVKKKVSM